MPACRRAGRMPGVPQLALVHPCDGYEQTCRCRHESEAGSILCAGKPRPGEVGEDSHQGQKNEQTNSFCQVPAHSRRGKNKLTYFTAPVPHFRTVTPRPRAQARPLPFMPSYLLHHRADTRRKPSGQLSSPFGPRLSLTRRRERPVGDGARTVAANAPTSHNVGSVFLQPIALSRARTVTPSGVCR